VNSGEASCLQHQVITECQNGNPQGCAFKYPSEVLEYLNLEGVLYGREIEIQHLIRIHIILFRAPWDKAGTGNEVSLILEEGTML